MDYDRLVFVFSKGTARAIPGAVHLNFIPGHDVVKSVEAYYDPAGFLGHSILLERSSGGMSEAFPSSRGGIECGDGVLLARPPLLVA